MNITEKDINKKFITRGGETVTIIDFWENKEMPVIGVYQYDIDEKTNDFHQWYRNGYSNVRDLDGYCKPCNDDLVKAID